MLYSVTWTVDGRADIRLQAHLQPVHIARTLYGHCLYRIMCEGVHLVSRGGW